MNKYKLRVLLLVSIFILSFSSVMFGQQDYGQLNGTVKDQNDAVVPGATVKLVSATKGTEKSTVTNSDGFYQFTSVLPDQYNVIVSGSGFTPVTIKTQVTTGGATTVNPKLGVAALINVVDVPAGTGGLAEINTTDQTQSTVVSTRQMQGLPTLDRDPYALVNLSGNISTADPDGRGWCPPARPAALPHDRECYPRPKPSA